MSDTRITKFLSNLENPKRIMIAAMILMIFNIFYLVDNHDAINKGKISNALYDFQQNCAKQNYVIMCVQSVTSFNGYRYDNFTLGLTNNSSFYNTSK